MTLRVGSSRNWGIRQDYTVTAIMTSTLWMTVDFEEAMSMIRKKGLVRDRIRRLAILNREVIL
jgi:hypothetical protein